jgi:hypothetical protein
MSEKYPEFVDLKGKRLTAVTLADDIVRFVCEDGKAYHLQPIPTCSESVDLVDVNGDLADLVGEVLGAEESSNSEDPPQAEEWTPESYTWTFYRIWTIKGSVVLRWYGTSNGYYCEAPQFTEATR